MTDEMRNRNYAIYHLRCNGWRLCDLARKFNLTSPRISVITEEVWRIECLNEETINELYKEFLPMFKEIAQ